MRSVQGVSGASGAAGTGQQIREGVDRIRAAEKDRLKIIVKNYKRQRPASDEVVMERDQ